MKEELDSQLSAMFDDELASAECELLARRLSRDGEIRARWERYAVIAAAIRAERGVRLNARVARRVSVIVGAEPALAAAAASGHAPRRWVRPVAGAAVAASVAAVSILWLRGHTVPGAVVAAPELAAVPASRVTAPAVVRAVARTAGPDSYVVPPAARGGAAIVPAELANYVVAHSMFSPPVARRNLLSSFMTSEPAAAGPIAVSTDGAQGSPRDAKGSAQ
ncbi:MAG TPA: sigma-E factor negative regulatory protein [Solirubrobacteraceae bacterium]|nr:sigma-E factor negative regulatory protein [Solirubrobacteraceae bacterium]